MTPKQSAALALARAYDEYAGPGILLPDAGGRLARALAAYRDAVRTAPDAPDLSALEREYLEACYAVETLSRQIDETCGDVHDLHEQADVEQARMEKAYLALHAARTRREPDAPEEILDRPWRELSKQDKHRVREILREQDQALAERTRRG